MVTLLIKLSSYEVYIRTKLPVVHEVIGICGLSMAFEGHICCSYMYVYSMENKICSVVYFYSYV